MSSVTACIWCLPFGPQALGPWSGLRKCRDRVEVTVLPVLTVQGSPRLHSLLRPLALAFPAPFTDVCPAQPSPAQPSHWDFSDASPPPHPSSCPEGPCPEGPSPSSAVYAGQSKPLPPQRNNSLVEFPHAHLEETEAQC